MDERERETTAEKMEGATGMGQAFCRNSEYTSEPGSSGSFQRGMPGEEHNALCSAAELHQGMDNGSRKGTDEIVTVEPLTTWQVAIALCEQALTAMEEAQLSMEALIDLATECDE